MKLYYEISFEDFAYNKCWQGARDTIDELTADEVKRLGDLLEEAFDEGTNETELNDFLWHERDTIAEWLGFYDFDDLMKKHRGEEDDEEESEEDEEEEE